MKRRTNLFYKGGPDSKFLTFSNYTEALTGHFLSTYTKLYPSRFLCCYIPDIDNNKSVIIEHLIKHYESKLAFLRDHFDGQSRSMANDRLMPLNYLLECLNKAVPGFEVRAINEITEQDYNGTYTDTICIVNLDSIISARLDGDLNKPRNPLLDKIVPTPKVEPTNPCCQADIDKWYIENSVVTSTDKPTPVPTPSPTPTVDDDSSDDDSTDVVVPTTVPTSAPVPNTDLNKSLDIPSRVEYKIDDIRNLGLYGWTTSELSGTEWSNLTSEFDLTEDGKNYYSLLYKNFISVTDTGTIKNELTFNCIIPLFDLVDTNYVTNNISLTELSKDNQELPATTTINVPYGIWFGNDIVLKRDNASGFAPSWSLSIASQFKPFPYSKQMPSEARNSEITNSFATFAQVLSQIAALSNKVDTLSSQLMDVNSRIDNITAQTTSQTVLDRVQKSLMANFKELQENNQKQLDEFRSILDTLRWRLDDNKS